MVIQIGIKISPKNMREAGNRQIQRVARISDSLIRKIQASAERSMINSIQRKTTTRTGTLVNSVTAITLETKSGQLDRRANITIRVNAPYASYVDRGTKPRKGRFIPMPNRLGRPFSLKNGSNIGDHPGNKPRGFSEDAAKNIRKFNSQLARASWVNPIARSFKRFQ